MIVFNSNGESCSRVPFHRSLPVLPIFDNSVHEHFNAIPPLDNIQLRCRAHNAYEAELFYGPAKVVRRDGVVREPSAVYSCVADPRTRSGASSDGFGTSAGPPETRLIPATHPH